MVCDKLQFTSVLVFHALFGRYFQASQIRNATYASWWEIFFHLNLFCFFFLGLGGGFRVWFGNTGDFGLGVWLSAWKILATESQLTSIDYLSACPVYIWVLMTVFCRLLISIS